MSDTTVNDQRPPQPASRVGRRAFLAGAAATAVLAAAPAATARTRAPVPAPSRTPSRAPGTAPTGGTVVRTTAGSVRGERAGALTVFRGVPYARPPIGPLRFASPRPPVPWSGVRDATAFSPISVQHTGTGGSEDSLYANVWTPDTAGRRPVLVYIHGGGWQLGAGSLPTYDGARLAGRGDLVVITFNYRLGAFGWGLHEDFLDAETGSAANWGLQDQVALVRWVHANAEAFGGDSGNITVCGTSAGGSSTWQLALLPELRGAIRRIVPISAAHAWTPAIGLTPDDARTAYELVAKDLGRTVRGLREVPALALRDSWQKVFAGSPTTRPVASGREYRGPVLDGRWMRGFDWELPTPTVPMMVVNTRTEGSFWTGPTPPGPPPTPVPTDEASLRAAVRGVLLKGAVEVSDARVEACVNAYRAAAAAEGLPQDPRSIWTEVWGDGLFRYQIVRLSERHARRGTSAQYVMDFSHPVRAPWFGTPHEATSKFLFGTHALPENVEQFGDGPLERQVSDEFIDLVSSFARDGVPGSAAVPEWPVFSPDRPTTLTLGGERVARLVTTPKSRQLRHWDDGDWVPRP
ncbi:carboxylesterase/lipase family protein [Streptomyces sp. URMC 123]|uniref:carboxylesterase/lipase family protein n=1 Tax=Streptomyces sp. URMC 123 TaxID=3423403 RepID=UPI003F1C9F08